jgi:hypothetical protein
VEVSNKIAAVSASEVSHYWLAGERPCAGMHFWRAPLTPRAHASVHPGTVDSVGSAAVFGAGLPRPMGAEVVAMPAQQPNLMPAQNLQAPGFAVDVEREPAAAGAVEVEVAAGRQDAEGPVAELCTVAGSHAAAGASPQLARATEAMHAPLKCAVEVSALPPAPEPSLAAYAMRTASSDLPGSGPPSEWTQVRSGCGCGASPQLAHATEAMHACVCCVGGAS